MKVLRIRGDAPVLGGPTVAAIGNFDGVHLGHQTLLAAAQEKSTQLGYPMMVIMFEPQPREYFSHDKSTPRLMHFRDKVQALQKRFDVDYVCCLRFDHKLSQMDARTFANSIVFNQLQVRCLFVGHDFRFGRDRLGDVALLQETGQRYRAEIHCLPKYELNGERVSSTRIRDALLGNNLEEASRLLGHAYSVSGRVMHGDAKGRSWGVPTANIALGKRSLPVRGVYCVRVKVDQETYSGVANVGCRPTVSGQRELLEVHLLNFSGDLYSRRLTVFFIHKLRKEKRFASLEQLISQIREDVLDAHAYFASDGSPGFET